MCAMHKAFSFVHELHFFYENAIYIGFFAPVLAVIHAQKKELCAWHTKVLSAITTKNYDNGPVSRKRIGFYLRITLQYVKFHGTVIPAEAGNHFLPNTHCEVIASMTTFFKVSGL